jgi:hypothetical protein
MGIYFSVRDKYERKGMPPSAHALCRWATRHYAPRLARQSNPESLVRPRPRDRRLAAQRQEDAFGDVLVDGGSAQARGFADVGAADEAHGVAPV